MAVLHTVLKRITPTKKEEQDISSLISDVEAAAKKTLGSLSYTLAGSYTRNTWMKDKKEIDIFLLFPEHTTRTTLEKKGLELGKNMTRALKGTMEVAYAEHPYTRAHYKGFSIDIVPCYKLSDPTKLKSSVDRTPFHNQYLAEYFPKELSREVRLLKQFLKAHGLYGSDTRTQGFSGYLCELLIVHYKSFSTLTKEASLWEPGCVLIDLENHGTRSPLFKTHPLIVIDPVDPKRNVAAVLSPLNFARFISLCNHFHTKPSLSLFFPSKKAPSLVRLRHSLKKRGTHLLALSFAHPTIIDDVLYPQLRRTASRLQSLLEDNDFRVLNHDVYTDSKQGILLFEMEVWSLPEVRKVTGPPLMVTKHAREFTKKYAKNRLWVENDRWTAEAPRSFSEAEVLLKHTLKKKPKALQELGIASFPAQSIAKRFSLLSTKQLLKKSQNKKFLLFLHDFLEQEIAV